MAKRGMSRHTAFWVVMERVVADMVGVGTGIRTAPTQKDREEVRQAVKVLSRGMIKRELSDEEMKNKGII